MAKKILYGSIFSFFVALFSAFIIFRISGYRHYVPISSSMHPKIPKYSLVYIKQTDTVEDLKIGDIIAYQGTEKPVLHRIIEIDGEIIQTQGDANDTPDAPIKFNQVIGKMVFSIPYIGILFVSPYPWLVILALIIICSLCRELIKEIHKK